MSIKSSVTLLILLVMQLFGALLSPIDSRVAIIICPSEDLAELEKQAIEPLQALGYEIIHVNATEYIPKVCADRVIVLYVGHSDPMMPNWMLTITNETIHLSWVLNKIVTDQLVLLTNTCFGGSWLNYAMDERIIISMTNDTQNWMDTNHWSTPDIATLLSYGQTNSVEESYQLWANELELYYEPFLGEYPFLGEVTPVIADGIAGDTYF